MKAFIYYQCQPFASGYHAGGIAHWKICSRPLDMVTQHSKFTSEASTRTYTHVMHGCVWMGCVYVCVCCVFIGVSMEPDGNQGVHVEVGKSWGWSLPSLFETGQLLHSQASWDNRHRTP